ncbi:MAG: hypothetical protein AAB691_01185 [Patescibacteria group bacterium]
MDELKPELMGEPSPETEESFEGDFELQTEFKDGHEGGGPITAHCVREGGKFVCRGLYEGSTIEFKQFDDGRYDEPTHSFQVSLRCANTDKEDWLVTLMYKDPERQVH